MLEQLSQTSSHIQTFPLIPNLAIKILIVDDEIFNQQAAKIILRESLNIDTTLLDQCLSFADNGQQALDMVKSSSHTFDLILMDINMPIMGGIEASKLIIQH